MTNDLNQIQQELLSYEQLDRGQNNLIIQAEPFQRYLVKKSQSMLDTFGRSPINTYDVNVWELALNINGYRETKKRAPLQFNDKLSVCAQKHADYMAATGKLSHIGKGRSRMSTRIKNEGYVYRKCAENITPARSAYQAVNRWVGSWGHRRNMLGKFTEFGTGEKNGYWCAVFALPRP